MKFFGILPCQFLDCLSSLLFVYWYLPAPSLCMASSVSILFASCIVYDLSIWSLVPMFVFPAYLVCALIWPCLSFIRSLSYLYDSDSHLYFVAYLPISFICPQSSRQKTLKNRVASSRPPMVQQRLGACGLIVSMLVRGSNCNMMQVPRKWEIQTPRCCKYNAKKTSPQKR